MATDLELDLAANAIMDCGVAASGHMLSFSDCRRIARFCIDAVDAQRNSPPTEAEDMRHFSLMVRCKCGWDGMASELVRTSQAFRCPDCGTWFEQHPSEAKLSGSPLTP